jgi:sialate O-acetylesterase
MKTSGHVISLILGCLLITPTLVFAQLKMPLLLSDGAIVQHGKPFLVWGWSSPDAKVSVTLKSEEQTVQANSQGEWQVEFKPLAAGEAFSLTVKSAKQKVLIHDLLAGDVWVASGQSNMEWELKNSLDAETELTELNNPNIRHFKVPQSWAKRPEDRLAGGAWQLADAQNAGSFSAVAYYFAKKVQKETGIPIGIIGSNWGGSAIQAWMPKEAFKDRNVEQEFDAHLERVEKSKEDLKKKLAKWPNANAQNIYQDNADWSQDSVDLAYWDVVKAPALWESQGFDRMNGIVWYKKQFNLTTDDINGDLLLSLARIDDNDTTWVNGTKVGSTDGYNKVRQYIVPKAALKSGNNTISIRVVDNYGGGGIYSEAALLYAKTANNITIPLSGDWFLRPDKVTFEDANDVISVATALYNKMIHPLFTYPVKGVIWYQGESDAYSEQAALEYQVKFRELINAWRANWVEPAMPFYWVQLASFDTNDGDQLVKPWAILRESQTAILTMPNTGQALALDVGNPKDIHPRDKKTVGERLANIALHKTYGELSLHYRGPIIGDVQLAENSLVVKFKTDKGLMLRADKQNNTNQVIGFEGVTADGALKKLSGDIEHESVRLSLDNNHIVELRYAWDDSPDTANLMDSSGLPAEPFRITL